MCKILRFFDLNLTNYCPSDIIIHLKVYFLLTQTQPHLNNCPNLSPLLIIVRKTKNKAAACKWTYHIFEKKNLSLRHIFNRFQNDAVITAPKIVLIGMVNSYNKKVAHEQIGPQTCKMRIKCLLALQFSYT